MNGSVSHDRSEESPQAKARWFQSLSLAERMDVLCEMADLILENNLRIAETKHAQSITGRVRVVELP